MGRGWLVVGALVVALATQTVALGAAPRAVLSPAHGGVGMFGAAAGTTPAAAGALGPDVVAADVQAYHDALHQQLATALQGYRGQLDALEAAGLAAPTDEQRYAWARRCVPLAATPADVRFLTGIVDGDAAALRAATPGIIQAGTGEALAAWQATLQQARAGGIAVADQQAMLRIAAQRATAITTLASYAAFAGQVAAHRTTLLRALGQQAVATLARLIVQGERQGTLVYEYASALGIGQAQSDLAQAQTPDAAAQAVAEAQGLVADLRAMFANLSDHTPYTQPHQSDLALLSYYHATTGKVIVISFREQALRAYDNGKLVFATLITSGRQDRPSPPGLWPIMARLSPTIFTSSELPGSPLWYAPTPVNYALYYHTDGDYIHDAWWRTSFGPGTNLPHYDPLAFNGGSHGCINVPLQPMAWLYAWTPVGTPVILY